MTTDTHAACIASCNACAIACHQCFAACLQEDDVAMMARCIALNVDGAAACQFAVGMMARGSAHAKSACSLCAAICDACASECAKHRAEHCLACSDACRACAALCRDMAH